MPIAPYTGTSLVAVTGDAWVVGVDVTDDESRPVGDAVMVAALTDPVGDTTTPVLAAVENAPGRYRVSLPVTARGRWVLSVAVSGTATGAVAFVAMVEDVTTAEGMPSVADVSAYLRTDKTAWDTTQVAGALRAEASDQWGRCHIPAAYPAALREALLRRVAVNLARRGVTLGVVGLESEGMPSRLVTWDAEIRRFEAGYPRLDAY